MSYQLLYEERRLIASQMADVIEQHEKRLEYLDRALEEIDGELEKILVAFQGRGRVPKDWIELRVKIALLWSRTAQAWYSESWQSGRL